MRREQNGKHTKGCRSALANRKAAVLAAERKRAFMARYRTAITGRQDEGIDNG